MLDKGLYHDAKRRIIIFDVQPKFDQETIDDCVYVAMKSLLAFHGLDLEIKEQNHFSGQSVSLNNLDAVLQENGLKPVPEEIYYSQYLYEALRNYGPLIVSLTPEAVGFLSELTVSEKQGHTIVICGVEGHDALVLIPKPSKKFLEENQKLLNFLFGTSDFDSGSKIQRVAKQFLEGSLKPYYLPSQFTNDLHVKTIETYHYAKTFMQNCYNSVSNFFKIVPNQPKKIDRLFIIVTLTKQGIENGMLNAIIDYLNHTGIMKKYSYEPFEFSAITQDNLIYWCYKRQNILGDVGILEARILPGFESKINSPTQIWHKEFNQYIKLHTFFSAACVNSLTIDSKNNTYQCNNPIYLDKDSHNNICLIQ